MPSEVAKLKGGGLVKAKMWSNPTNRKRKWSKFTISPREQAVLNCSKPMLLLHISDGQPQPSTPPHSAPTWLISGGCIYSYSYTEQTLNYITYPPLMNIVTLTLER